MRTVVNEKWQGVLDGYAWVDTQNPYTAGTVQERLVLKGIDCYRRGRTVFYRPFNDIEANREIHYMAQGEVDYR
jgi:hypothetical protein